VPKACPSCGARYPADALFCSLDGSPLTTSPGAIAAAAANDYYVGREILGHIEIRQLVGLGAMGRVYRAFQKGIDRDVAVKILHRELSSNAAVVARFTREAKVAARLSHPNVVHVLLVGQLPDGAMYIVMEYLDGMSLQSALAAGGGALALPRTLHIALQLCEAAGAAHEGGIVHRDLKPENIMLIERAGDPDFVKVLDFGIARLSWADASMATAAGLVFGTARYISPEGAAGEKVGPQGDVYSIATMVYQMCAGRTPFAGEQAVSLLVQQIHDPPPALESIARAAHVPKAIAETVMKNLSKKPDERAEDARAFGRSLLEAAMASGLSAQDILARPSLLPGGRHGRPLPSVGQGGTEYSTPAPSHASVPAGDGFGSSSPTPPPDGRTVVSTEIADPTDAPPGVATAKWVPPPAVRASLTAAMTPSPRVAPTQASDPPLTATAGPPPPSSKPSSTVDPTLADEPSPRSSITTAPPATRAAPPPRSRTPMVVALAAGVALLVAVPLVLPTGRIRRDGAPPSGGALAQRTDIPGEVSPGASSSPATAASMPPVAPVDPIPPLQGIGAQQTMAAPAATTGPLRVAVETSSARPSVGQPVDLAARITGGASGRPRIDNPKFRVSGPGIPPGTELTAVDDGAGVYRSTFTFLQPGRFDVSFTAHADGAAARAGRTLVVDDPNAPAPPAASPQQASSTAPAAAASPPAKWM
jgi:serine/threonine-protein kinase